MSKSVEEPVRQDVADEDEATAQCGLTDAEAARGSSTDRMLRELLSVGPAGERAGAASNARAASGPKGIRAAHARETLDILAAGGYTSVEGPGWVDIRTAVLQAVEASTFYPEANFHCQASSSSARPEPPLSIQVSCSTTLAAAAEIAAGGLTPGVLNFASARNPGGGFTTGAEAQEESLARSSALYPCLSKHFASFFVPRRQEASGAYTHDMIFSPKVPVIRDSSGTLLEQPYMADFVTAAAPNVSSLQRVHGDKAEAVANAALKERASRVLEVFARHSVTHLVLGAWGCGVFRNNPIAVARTFQEHLAGRFKGCFHHVTFAVLDPKMAQVFADTFNTPLLAESSNGSAQPSAAKGNYKRRWRGSR